MDGPGLRAYLIEHREDLRDTARSLDLALLVAPDPGFLVLAAATGFCRAPHAQGEADGDAKVSCRLLIDLLDRIRALGVKPSPEAREEARAVAADWKRCKRIEAQALFKKETIAFLLLVGVFGLVEDVGGADGVLDLAVSVSSRQRAIEIFLGLGLDLHKQMQGVSLDVSWESDEYLRQLSSTSSNIQETLIQKMINKGKQLDAGKFIQSLSLAPKYPLLHVLRSYMNDAKNSGNMIRIRGDESASQDAGDAKERTLLGALQKFIKEHKLAELPILEEANKRMAQLEQQSAERKQAASAAAAAAAATAAAAHEVSKNIMASNRRLQFPENAVQASLGQNMRLVGTFSQQTMPRQSIHTVGVQNQCQAASRQNMLPSITHNPLLAAGSQGPIGIQNQARPVTPFIQAQYYGLASSRPSGLNVPSVQTSSRFKLYSADALASLSRASDKKSSSYNYSLSNMSKYNP